MRVIFKLYVKRVMIKRHGQKTRIPNTIIEAPAIGAFLVYEVLYG
jgi:hypothetical protein